MTHSYNVLADDKIRQADCAVSPVKLQVPAELEALWDAVDRCEKVFALIESRLAPFCLEFATPLLENEASTKPLCDAADNIRRIRFAVNTLHARLQTLDGRMQI